MSVPSRTFSVWALGGETDRPLANDTVRILGAKSVADLERSRARRGVWGVVVSITGGVAGMGVSRMEAYVCLGSGSGEEGMGISMVNTIGTSGGAGLSEYSDMGISPEGSGAGGGCDSGVTIKDVLGPGDGGVGFFLSSGVDREEVAGLFFFLIFRIVLSGCSTSSSLLLLLFRLSLDEHSICSSSDFSLCVGG